MKRGRPKRVQSRPGGNRAVITLRVSLEEQAKPDHYGLPAQESDTRKYCEKMGYEVLSVQVDPGISGTKPIEKRPGLLAAVLLCEAGEADVIVAAKQDRFSRKSAVFDALRDRAKRGKFRLEVCDTGMDLSHEDNFLTAEIGSFITVIDRHLIAMRLKGGRRERSKKDGLGSGPVPFGYQKQEGRVVENKTALKPIRTLLQLRAEGKTYQATADELNRKRYRTAKGRKWTIASVQAIEQNQDLYRTGVRRWNGITAEQRWPILYTEGEVR